MELIGVFAIIIALLAIAVIPIVITFFVVRAIINYSAKRTAEEIVKQLNLRQETKRAMRETITETKFDAIARIFIAEYNKDQAQKNDRTGAGDVK